MDYNVVFVYTEKVPNYAGVRTRSSWESKADFDKVRHLYGPDKNEDIVAEGISDKESERISAETPLSASKSRVEHLITESVKERGYVDEVTEVRVFNQLFVGAIEEEERKRLARK